MRHATRQFRILLVLAGVVFAAGCQSGRWQGFPQSSGQGLVWPTAPATPRVVWVMQITGHEDLFREAGFWTGLKRWVGGPRDSHLAQPNALALHPAGGLLVSDPGRGCVHGFFWNDRDYVTYGLEREGGLPSPVGVAALDDGRVIVSDSKLGQLLAYERGGKALGRFAADVEFQRAAGMAFDAAAGRLFVADVLRHQVAELTPAGELVRWIGSRGGAPGQFNFPTHVATTGDGGIAVTDSMNFRAQLLTAQGAPAGTIGRLGNAPGTFAKPKGVAVSGDVVAVVEGLHDSLQFFNRQGALLMSLGSSGQGPGQFWLPKDVCWDRTDGLVFVADDYNHRVQVFRMLEVAQP